MLQLILTQLHAAYITLKTSIPTIWDGVRGRLTPELADRRLAKWRTALQRRAGYQIEVIGREHLTQTPAPWVVMSNHQSLYDIPALYEVFPDKLRMVAKIELRRIPFFGKAMEASGFIFVDRGNRTKAIQSINQARRTLQTGISVWIAPEGTRSRTGELLPFKKGGFVLCEDTGLPVIPVSIEGTRNILPAKTLRLRRGAKVRITIHPPMRRQDFAKREDFIASVRARIASGLDQTDFHTPAISKDSSQGPESLGKPQSSRSGSKPTSTLRELGPSV